MLKYRNCFTALIYYVAKDRNAENPLMFFKNNEEILKMSLYFVNINFEFYLSIHTFLFLIQNSLVDNAPS